ncbi:MAG: cobalamin-dependent protein [Peptococcaceae bacterium]|nr:cobalamin-dependent protein [Peptococcaceae bacterium]
MTQDLNIIRPYGDTLNDGLIQLSFTLPLAKSAHTEEAAKQLVLKLGLVEPQIVYSEDIGANFTFFIAYAQTNLSVNVNELRVIPTTTKVLRKQEIEACIKAKLGRQVVVLGACIESDAHTVGIDAIMNLKGYNGHKGLEAYQSITAINLGAQISGEELVVKARECGADAILVSQVVTQKNIHIANLTRLAELLEAENVRERVILVVGGPRINHQLAQELGYDAGFGSGTYAEDVATFVVETLIKREELGNAGSSGKSGSSGNDSPQAE